MVGKRKETVGIDKETASFIEAFDFIKNEKRMTYKKIAESIGMSDQTNNMIRAGRRMAHNDEIQVLVKVYPFVKHFFEKPPVVEDFQADNYGKTSQEVLDYSETALKAQEKTIEMQEEVIRLLKKEIKEMREEVNRLLSKK